MLYRPNGLIATCKNSQVNRGCPDPLRAFGDYSASMGLKLNQFNSIQFNSSQLKSTQRSSQPKSQILLFSIYLIKFKFYFHRHFVLPFFSFPPYGTVCSTFSIFLCSTFLGLIRCKTYSYKALSVSLPLTPLGYWSADRFVGFVPITIGLLFRDQLLVTSR